MGCHPIGTAGTRQRAEPAGDRLAPRRPGGGRELAGGTVLLLAPRGIVVDGLAALLEREWLSVVAPPGEAASFGGPADVALVHESFPDALAVMEALRGRSPPIRAVLLLDRWDERGLGRLVASCAAGVIVGSQPTADLLRGLAVMAVGGAVLPARPYPQSVGATPSAPQLTAREADVLALLIDRHGTRDIARMLGISVNTAAPTSPASWPNSRCTAGSTPIPRRAGLGAGR